MKPIVIIAMVSILLIPSIAFAETPQEAAERRLEEKKIQTGWYDQNVLTPTPSANSIGLASTL